MLIRTTSLSYEWYNLVAQDSQQKIKLISLCASVLCPVQYMIRRNITSNGSCFSEDSEYCQHLRYLLAQCSIIFSHFLESFSEEILWRIHNWKLHLNFILSYVTSRKCFHLIFVRFQVVMASIPIDQLHFSHKFSSVCLEMVVISCLTFLTIFVVFTIISIRIDLESLDECVQENPSIVKYLRNTRLSLLKWLNFCVCVVSSFSLAWQNCWFQYVRA